MSALSQQQQQSTQVQQPSQQQGAQQGPVPEAAAFGAGNAVDFQSAYGNEAVAGMVGVEGTGLDAGAAGGDQEGGSFEKDEPQLAREIAVALERSGAALSGSGDWSAKVPPSLQADADRVVNGLADVDGYLASQLATLEKLHAAEERDESAIVEAILSTDDLLDRVDVATQLVQAYETLYYGSVAEVAGAACALAAFANVGADLLEMREKAQSAEETAQEAFASMQAAAQDIAEVNLQTAAQAGLMIAEDAAKTSILGATGPLGLPIVLALGLVCGFIGDKIDENLGTEPADLTNGIDSVAGDLSTHAGRITTVAEATDTFKPYAKSIGDKLGAFDKALLVFEGVEEGTAATKAFIEAATDYGVAQKALHDVCAEAEAVYNEQIPELLERLSEIPDLVEEAKAEATAAAAEIAGLEDIFGGDLYSPPA